MNFLFRADASVTTGAGHIVRCLALADGLHARGNHCTFSVSTETLQTVPILSDSVHEVLELPKLKATDAFLSACPDNLSWLVVDHYQLGIDFESACREKSDRILVIDDLASRDHDADVLIDPTLGRDPADYKEYVPDNCQLCVGADYALLREQFAMAREQSLARQRDKCRRIFISFGATDPQGYTLTVLKLIAQTRLDVSVDVMMGNLSPYLDEICQFAKSSPFPVRVHEQVTDVARLMADADLAIGAAGSTAWERCCLGLPAIVVVAADNQRQIAASLKTAGAAIPVEIQFQSGLDQLATILQSLALDGTRLQNMSKLAADVCDGRGIERICAILLS